MEASCALMAARLKQIGRDQKRVTRAAVISTLREAVAMATQRYSMAGALARSLWGVTSKRGTWRKAYWTGRRATMKSLGLSRYAKGAARVGARWDRWRRDYKRGANAAAKVRGRGGSGIPLIVRIARTRWTADTLQSGLVVRGAAAHIEEGRRFRSHRMPNGATHPGSVVHRHPVIERVAAAYSARLSGNVKAAVDGFLAGALNG